MKLNLKAEAETATGSGDVDVVLKEGNHAAQWAKDDSRAERSAQAMQLYIFVKLIVITSYIVLIFVDEWVFFFYSKS